MEDAADTQLDSENNPSQHQAPACETGTVLAGNFWGNPDIAGKLWADCLATHATGESPVEKLLAMARLFGIHRLPDFPYSIANLAWTNGAFVAAAGHPLSALQRITGDQSAAAQSLLLSVLQVRGVAGSRSCPIEEQRLLLARALPPDPVGHFGSLLNLANVAAQAGWLAYNAAFLVSARIVEGSTLSYAQYFLGVQLLREIKAWESASAADAFVRFLADYYPPHAIQEMQEMTFAASSSLEEARRRGWSPWEFLLDALRRGRALARYRPTQARGILLETGITLVEKIETTFENAGGKTWRNAGPAEAWQALQDYLRRVFPSLVSAVAVDAGLLLLRQSYDFLFWYALLAESGPVVSQKPCIIRIDLQPTFFRQTSSNCAHQDHANN